MHSERQTIGLQDDTELILHSLSFNCQKEWFKTYIIFIQDGKADSARRVDIRMEESLWELALWRLARIILREM
jgi:hypothetical protein